MSEELRTVNEIICEENLVKAGFEKTTSKEDICPECGYQLVVRWLENVFSEEVSIYACCSCGWRDDE